MNTLHVPEALSRLPTLPTQCSALATIASSNKTAETTTERSSLDHDEEAAWYRGSGSLI